MFRSRFVFFYMFGRSRAGGGAGGGRDVGREGGTGVRQGRGLRIARPRKRQARFLSSRLAPVLLGLAVAVAVRFRPSPTRAMRDARGGEERAPQGER